MPVLHFSRLHTLITAFLITFAVCKQTFASGDVDTLVRLDRATVWLINEGVARRIDDGAATHRERLVKDFGVFFVATPGYDVEKNFADFRIRRHGIIYEVFNPYGSVIEGKLYEYWAVKKVPQNGERAGYDTRIFITKTDSLLGVREIIHESDTFFSEYRISEDAVLRFPVDDPEPIYHMSPWLFQNTYAGTPLEGRRAGILNGEYRFMVRKEKE